MSEPGLRARLIDYCGYVLRDDSPTCTKHRWACLRFVNDLGREGTEGFPYRFDDSAGQKFLDWMRLFPHSKGPLAGTPKIPEPIEEFIFGQIYGWVHRDTGHRRFRYAYWQVARKNAKSQDLAIVALYELAALGEQRAEVYIAATKREQTRHVFSEAEYIYEHARGPDGRKLFSDRFKTKGGKILHPRSGSEFSRLTKEDRRKDDGQNPQCGIIDEYHAHETTEFYDLLTSGMKTRTQPLLMIITTAGFDTAHPCYRDEYQYVERLLDPDNTPTINDQYFALVNELDKDAKGELVDDPFDPNTWPKANPILCLTDEGRNSLAAEALMAKDKPEKLRDFLTKSVNVWVLMREAGYLDMPRWGAAHCKKLPDFSGLPCCVGVDLSSKLDLTSVAVEFQIDERYYFLSHSFRPAEGVEAAERNDRVPYMQWADAGYITLTPGPVVDHGALVRWVLERIERYGWVVDSWCVDPWGAAKITQDLHEAGHRVIDIVQGPRTLSEPTKEFRELVYQGRALHDGNPALTWAAGNAVITHVGANENIQLHKPKSNGRIDPIVACINAHTRAMSGVLEPQDIGGLFF